jgi:hypothetical protein
MRTDGPRTAHAPPRAALGRLLAALVLVAGAAGAAAASSAEAGEVEAAGACDGVWVVVDARKVGGSITTRCASGNPESGLAALKAAGHTYEFVPRVPGMVCTIDRRPDPCNGAPSDAYWSYWHAEEGGSWTYASRGAGSRDPQPGEVEGWAFGSGDEPGTSPPAPAPDGGSTDDDSADGSTDEPSSGDGTSGSSGSSGDDSSQDSGAEPTNASPGGSSTSSAGTGDTRDDTDAPEAADDDQTTTEPDDEPATDSEQTDDDESHLEAEEDAPEQDEDARPEIDETRGNQGPAAERGDDVVSLPAPDEGGNGWAGLALGAGLTGALAAGAAWQVRRRRLQA